MLTAAVLVALRTRWLCPRARPPRPERGMNHPSSSPSVSRAGTILPWHPRLPSLGGRHPPTHPAILNVGGIKSPGCTVGPEESCALRAESQRVGVRKWRDASPQMAQQKPELLRQYWQKHYPAPGIS